MISQCIEIMARFIAGISCLKLTILQWRRNWS